VEQAPYIGLFCFTIYQLGYLLFYSVHVCFIRNEYFSRSALWSLFLSFIILYTVFVFYLKHKAFLIWNDTWCVGLRTLWLCKFRLVQQSSRASTLGCDNQLKPGHISVLCPSFQSHLPSAFRYSTFQSSSRAYCTIQTPSYSDIIKVGQI